MDLAVLRGMRQTRQYLTDMDAAADTLAPATAWRVARLRRHFTERAARLAAELELEAQQDDASPEVRSLAAAVRTGQTTWVDCLTGATDHLPALQAVLSPHRPVDRDDTDIHQSVYGPQ